jgi:hypothetical protein
MNKANPVSPIINLFERLRQRRTTQPGAFGKAKNRPTEHDFPYTHPRGRDPFGPKAKRDIPVSSRP